MKQLLNAIIDVTTGKVSKEGFLKACDLTINDVPDFVNQVLKNAMENKDAELIEAGMLIGFHFYFPDNIVELLCKLIVQKWHHKHEDMVHVLQIRKDPSTVGCLYTAAQMELAYLYYDDSSSFARRCIKALSAIDTKEAVEKIKLLAEHTNPYIKKYAEKELSYKGL